MRFLRLWRRAMGFIWMMTNHPTLQAATTPVEKISRNAISIPFFIGIDEFIPLFPGQMAGRRQQLKYTSSNSLAPLPLKERNGRVSAFIYSSPYLVARCPIITSVIPSYPEQTSCKKAPTRWTTISRLSPCGNGSVMRLGNSSST